MSVSEDELLTYGEALAQESTEICWRASVGRSYYAAYHRSDAWHEALPTQGIAPTGMGMHRTLIHCLSNPSVSGKTMLRSKSIGFMLGVVKAARQKCDYDLTGTVDQGEALTAAASSKIILEKAG